MNIVLMVAGASYSGFKRVSLNRSVEQVAGTFDAEVTNKNMDLFQQVLPMRPGGAVTIIVDGELVFTGWVENVDIDLMSEDHKIIIAGASKTIDMVDTASVHTSGQFKQEDASQIATKLVSNMQIGVKSEIQLTPIPNYRIEDAESVLATVMRAAHRDGALVTDNEFGELVLTEGGKAGNQGSIREGTHFTAARASFDYTQVFSDYRVKGQSSLVDETWGRAAVDILGVAQSEAPGRPRTLIIHDHTDTDRDTVRKRALWEGQRRAAQATRASVECPSWKSETGKVWKPNSIVYFSSPTLGLEQSMMIVSASMSYDADGGSNASLELQPPDAFKAAPTPEGARNSTGSTISKPGAVTGTPMIKSGSVPDAGSAPLNTTGPQ